MNFRHVAEVRKEKKMSSLGDRIRLARETLSLSVADAAEATGVNRESWRRYESDMREPKVSVFLALSELGISARWLLSGQGEPLRSDAQNIAPIEEIDEDLMDDCISGIVRLYRELDHEIPAHKLSCLSAKVYNEIMAISDGPEDYSGALKAILATERKNPRALMKRPEKSGGKPVNGVHQGDNRSVPDGNRDNHHRAVKQA